MAEEESPEGVEEQGTEDAPDKQAQKKPTQDDTAVAESPKAPQPPTSGIAAVAETVEKEAQTQTPKAGTGNGTEHPEGRGLFFPDASKIKQRASKAPGAPQKAPTPPTEPQQDTPNAETDEAGEDEEGEEEVEEEEHPPIQRPPPPSEGPQSAPPPKTQPPNRKSKKEFGADGIVGYITPTPRKPGEKRFALVVDNLSQKDINYIAFMCKYLADPSRKYIPIGHPTYLVKFALNLLLLDIKEELRKLEGPENQ